MDGRVGLALPRHVALHVHVLHAMVPLQCGGWVGEFLLGLRVGLFRSLMRVLTWNTRVRVHGECHFLQIRVEAPFVHLYFRKATGVLLADSMIVMAFVAGCPQLLLDHPVSVASLVWMHFLVILKCPRY